MTHKERLLLRAGMLFVAIASITGLALLFVGRDIREPSTSFELLVFGMSSVALVLAIIQGITIERQMREIKKSSRTLSQAVKELQEVVASEKKQNKLLQKDMELDQALVKVLEKYDVITAKKRS